MEIDFGAGSVVANLQSAFIQVGVVLSLALEVELSVLENEAAVVAGVVNDWFKATNVGINKRMNNWLSHCVCVFILLV